ncbi:hypothetical protein H4Q26_013483 [Puccinia striiformis f. sp. tritici PST-130]|nr:hypothetical protein H4Q26_013483 [Puccinia striiformis f. sp. tritici PST-130]
MAASKAVSCGAHQQQDGLKNQAVAEVKELLDSIVAESDMLCFQLKPLRTVEGRGTMFRKRSLLAIYSQ